MDAEVRDDNPYSRLMALKRMGVVPNYEDIRLRSVLVVGVGGVGSVVCEMLTRCGIGKLIMYDYDRVEVANMNRLFFTPDQVGLSKVEAARQTLAKINPTVVVEAYDINISSNDGFAHLQEKIKTGGLNNDRISLVLSCVDNYAARMTINSACNEDDQVWMESGVSEDAMSAHIQLIIPGETACFACATPVAVHDDNEATIKRPGVCAASLPTTMGITAGFLAQNALKYLLNFGQTTSLLSYNALFDHFQNYAILPNSDCKDNHCRQRQALNSEHKRLKALKREQKQEQAKHEENDWGIEVIQEGQSESKPVVQNDTEIISEQSLEQLMSQLKQL